ncbi:hypothetical protein SZN_28653 [Streptomyces zinciresistens K42]|uniref:Uncharacterized protein n=1 Tax=Streptomyces zinciresistens K42 TaxID=700597 RepID=G2GJN8_9ACTN|nr:hypothetical protein SZN_28653 [Streptomyces zinciresistens K42]
MVMGAGTAILVRQPGAELGEAVVHFASGMPADDTAENTFAVSKRACRAAEAAHRWDTGVVRFPQFGRIVLGDVADVRDRRPDGSAMNTGDGAGRAGSA